MQIFEIFKLESFSLILENSQPYNFYRKPARLYSPFRPKCLVHKFGPSKFPFYSHSKNYFISTSLSSSFFSQFTPNSKPCCLLKSYLLNNCLHLLLKVKVYRSRNKSHTASLESVPHLHVFNSSPISETYIPN